MTDLVTLIADWLPHQRWFAGKGRGLSGVSAEATVLHAGDTSADDPTIGIQLVRVDYADGEPETYLVPLTLHEHPREHMVHALVGETDTGQGPRWVYDAVHDRESTPNWMRLLAEGATRGPIRFHREPGARLPVDVTGDAITVEQSNSSLVFGEQVILKLFRRLEPGLNPDVEVHAALYSRDNPHIAPMLGYIDMTVGDLTASELTDTEPAEPTEPVVLGMAQTFLPSASDGWSLASASVRDLLAEADLHPDEVGGDFAPEAHRLGQATASVHADLAAALPTGSLDPAGLDRLAASMEGRLGTAISVVPQMAEYAPALRPLYDAVRHLDAPMPVQRVHGDLHLGQVLRTTAGWTLLDFEGEPTRPLRDRRGMESPLRDVAGMLRSFDYAARTLLLDEPDDPQLNYRAAEWAGRNCEAFCDGYAETAGRDPRLDSTLLRAMEADKAVYEVLYEARTRPRWLPIPLHAVERISAEAKADQT